MFPLKDNIPTNTFPVVTISLIVLNALVFIFFQDASFSFSGASVDDAKTIEYGAIPYELTHPGNNCVHQLGEILCEGQPNVRGEADPQAATLVTVFTSMFMHGGLLHIIGNMLFLWIFGNNLEEAMGKLKFIAFYLLGGIAALAGQTLISPDAAIPTIGASGAVAAVLGGYILLHPRAKVLTLVFIIFFFGLIELPAVLMLGLWFLQQVYFGASGLAQPIEGGGGVAYFAHIGGFVFGLAMVKVFADRSRVRDPEPKLPVY